jgi:hypothetical protein
VLASNVCGAEPAAAEASGISNMAIRVTDPKSRSNAGSVQSFVQDVTVFEALGEHE